MEQITREEIVELIARELDITEAVLTDPASLRRMKAERIASRVFAALQAAEPAMVIEVSRGVYGTPAYEELFFNESLENGRHELFTLPCPPAKALVPIGEVIEEMSSDPEFIKGLEDGRRWMREVKAQVPDEQVAFEEWARTDPLLGEHELDRNPEDSDDYDNLFTQAAWNAWQARSALTASPAKAQVPDVDALAQFIRSIDGDHKMGAGALAEKIVEWLTAAPAPERSTKRHNWDDAGERCLDCGDRDWFAGPVCKGKQEEAER